LREAGWSNRRIGRHLGRERYSSCSVLPNSGSQKVECTVAEVRTSGTQMIARIVQSKSGHFGTNNVAGIDSTPLTSFQTSSAIRETIRRRRPKLAPGADVAKTLTTDPIIIGSVDWILPTSANLECDRLGAVSSSVMNRFSLSADDHRTRVWRRTRPAVRSGIYCRRHTAISQGVTV
ncbi:hypothetical protein TNCV_4192161, partial [Trichonephila clavipes]